MTRSCELAGDAASKAPRARAEPRNTASDDATIVPSRHRARMRRRLAASAAKVAASRRSACDESGSAVSQWCATMCACQRCATTLVRQAIRRKRWHGRRWQPAVTRMRETVSALRPILRGERSAFAGTEVATDGFRLAAGAQTQTTIAVAAFGPRMLAAAAAIADRVVLNVVTVAQLARVRDPVP